AAHLGNVVDFKPIELAPIGETKEVGMGRCDKEVFDEIIFARSAARDSFAAPMLTAIGVKQQALDVAVMADSDRVDFFGNQFFVADSPLRLDDLGAAIVAIFVAHLAEIGSNNIEDVAFAAEQPFVGQNLLPQRL